MGSRNKHPVSFGDVLCNIKTGLHYVVAGATKALNGRRRFYATCLEVSASYECLPESPISFDKETVSELVFITNISDKLQDHFKHNGFNFSRVGLDQREFSCKPN